jgi:hypothetical protein
LVFWKNILPDLFDHVVQVDISKIKDRPVVEPGMEIFIANQYDQFTDRNGDGDFEVALLKSKVERRKTKILKTQNLKINGGQMAPLLKERGWGEVCL